MPTATIYSDATGDGWVLNSDSTWNGCRDDTAGTISSGTGGSNAYGIRNVFVSGRGGGLYYINRSFLYFDTSSITSYPTSVTLQVYGHTNTGIARVSCVKSTHGTSISTADFDAIDGWDNSGGNQSGNLTFYANNTSSWSNSSYNDFTLNSTAISDIRNNDYMSVCLMDFDNDIRNGSAPTNTSRVSGLKFTEYGGITTMPRIVVNTADAVDTPSTFFGANF